ncbi:MAG: beta-ketoacyl synthase N-terminal-like domain-containing protein [Labilithrix sp.]
MKRRAVTGLGIASALGTSTEAFFDAFRSGKPEAALANRPPLTSFDASKYAEPPVIEVPSFDPTVHLGDKGLRTLDRLTKLLVVAARLALHDAGLKKDNAFGPLGPNDVGVCCSNAYGSLEAITELDRVAVLEDARYINPAKFPNTVSNSAAGYVSIWEDLRALNVSVSDGNCGALDAVSCADIFFESARASAILTGGGESMSEALYLAFDKLGVLGVQVPAFATAAEKTKLGEGAAFLVLEPEDLADKRGAKKLAVVTGYGTAFIGPKDELSLLFASSASLERAIAGALEDAGITSSDVDLVVSGMAGIEHMDKHERAAIQAAVRADAPIAAPKQIFGETLGAGGALAMAASLAWLDGAPASCLVAGTAPAKVATILVTSIGYYGNASALVMRRA